MWWASGQHILCKIITDQRKLINRGLISSICPFQLDQWILILKRTCVVQKLNRLIKRGIPKENRRNQEIEERKLKR